MRSGRPGALQLPTFLAPFAGPWFFRVTPPPHPPALSDDLTATFLGHAEEGTVWVRLSGGREASAVRYGEQLPHTGDRQLVLEGHLRRWPP